MGQTSTRMRGMRVRLQGVKAEVGAPMPVKAELPQQPLQEAQLQQQGPAPHLQPPGAAALPPGAAAGPDSQLATAIMSQDGADAADVSAAAQPLPHQQPPPPPHVHLSIAKEDVPEPVMRMVQEHAAFLHKCGACGGAAPAQVRQVWQWLFLHECGAFGCVLPTRVWRVLERLALPVRVRRVKEWLFLHKRGVYGCALSARVRRL